MPDGITKETFKGFDTDSKLNTLFDYTIDTKADISEIKQQISKRKKIDTTVAACMGFIGGFAAMAGKWIVGK